MKFVRISYWVPKEQKYQLSSKIGGSQNQKISHILAIMTLKGLKIGKCRELIVTITLEKLLGTMKFIRIAYRYMLLKMRVKFQTSLGTYMWDIFDIFWYLNVVCDLNKIPWWVMDESRIFSGLKIILKNHIKSNLPLKMQVYFFVNIMSAIITL